MNRIFYWPPFCVWTLCGDTSGEWIEWRYQMGTAVWRKHDEK